MRNAVKLEDLDTLPKELSCLVRSLEDRLACFTAIDSAVNEDLEVYRVASTLEEALQKCDLVAYHCTKELEPGYFAQRGLRILNIDQHVGQFYEIVQKTAPLLLAKFKSEHRSFHEDCILGTSTRDLREGSIHLWLSLGGLTDNNCWRSFAYFGGEAIYWPFDDRNPDDCLRFLKELGSPKLIEVRVSASAVDGLDAELPLSRVVLSAYAYGLYPGFEQVLECGFVKSDIAPGDVLSVRKPSDVLPRSVVTGLSWWEERQLWQEN